MRNQKSKSILAEWLECHEIDGVLQPLRGDASFRQYYRIEEGKHKGIVMDASSQPESVAPFVDISHRLHGVGVRTPKIHASDTEKGYVFMEDLGSTHMCDLLEAKGESTYEKALETICKMQQAETEGLPPYDRDFLLFEMKLMPEWYLDTYLQATLSSKERYSIDKTLGYIAKKVMEQPQGLFVHRDFHSRNLMFDANDALVVIDFQDARVGVVTYDLVSLLRDVYVELDPKEVERLALHFRDIRGVDVSDETFMQWFDFMGLQRHIKILGIFARLALRDGKENYLKDIPLTLKYIIAIAGKYGETKRLGELLQTYAEQ